MVRRVAFAVPGDLATPTGGYAYDRRMIRELEHLAWEIDIVDLGEGFPYPSAEQREKARRRLNDGPAKRPIIIDGLAFGVLPDVATELSRDHALCIIRLPSNRVCRRRRRNSFARASARR